MEQNKVTNTSRRINLITTCTKGKHIFSQSEIPQIDVTGEPDVNELLRLWREKLFVSIKYGNPEPAVRVYRGAHWNTARKIVRDNEDVDLWVISAGLGLLHASERIVPYDASFNSLPVSPSSWWDALTRSFNEGRKAASIHQLMQERRDENFVIAGSPAYISAVENDIQAGTDALISAIDQLTIVTSTGYIGQLDRFVTRSHAYMMNSLNSNSVCLNIKHAQYIIKHIRRENHVDQC